MEATMKPSFTRWSLLALACLALGACKDQREPVKPTTLAGTVQATSR
jgi:hypothetical protein